MIDQYITGFMVVGGFGDGINFVLLEICIRNRMRIFYYRFLFLLVANLRVAHDKFVFDSVIIIYY